MKVGRWLGQPVYKLAEDQQGREVQLEGRVVNFCPNARQFELRYEDGSTEGVSVEEIEDYVPILRQLSMAERRSPKKRRAGQGSEAAQQPEESTPAVKRARKAVASCKVEEPGAPLLTPEDEDEAAAVMRHVQDALWPLTAALNISADRQQALLAALDNRNEQPLAALARFASEGGVDVVSDALKAWASRATEGCAGDEETDDHCAGEDESPPRRATTRSPRRTTSPCSQHLLDLMTGAGVSSPKPMKAKEQHISPPPQHAPHFPVVTDLTADPPSDEDETEEEDEEEDDTASSRRVHFGINSTIRFRRNDTADGLLQRAGYKTIKVPTQNPEAWKSALKSSTTW